jgi:hypothetical protein
MASGMELLLSVRTDRLDASATMNVTTMLPPGAERSWFDPATQSLHAEEDFPADERSESNRFPTAYVARGALEEYDYFEMIQPADFAGLSVAQQDDCRSTSWRLFPESLEKGVIRRARLSACLLPSGAPAQRVHQAYQQFLTAPLPLTT